MDTCIHDNQSIQAELLEHFSKQFSIGIFSFDMKGTCLYANSNFLKILGCRSEEFYLKPISDMISAADLLLLKTTAETGGKRNLTIQARHRDGRQIFLRILYVKKAGNRFYVATDSRHADSPDMDAACQKQMDKRLKEIGHYDFLTKLPNRSYFEKMLDQGIALAQNSEASFSILLIELHGLKFVNDSLGMRIGDELIRKTAGRLSRVLMDKGTLFRINGDEFAVILPNSSVEESEQMAEKILPLFSRSFILDDYELFHPVNIGISLFPDHGRNAQTLIRNAYASLQQAKVKGKNRYHLFSSQANNELKKKYQLNIDLPKALKKEELYIDFQPRIDLKTNEITGAEALVRWKHPKWGNVPPMEFIPLAEKNGVIGLIGKTVLLNACRQNKQWQDAGLPQITVSVNLSVIEFLQLDVVETVKEILADTGLGPEWLEIELTESALMIDEATVMKKLHQLREMGVKTAIDDFGTGYASLSYLQSFQANTLKIDRSFISDIHMESSSFEIVNAITGLAKNLNIRTTAEGVETIEQLSILLEINCDEVQGYLYSPPVSAAAFEKLLEKKYCFPF